MIHYKNFKCYSPKIEGKRNKFDNNVYTFDIETTSYFILNGKQYAGIEYENLSEDDKKECEFKSCMYIWMLSINDDVYYGRTWDELKDFLYVIDMYIPERKIIFVHNLSFEFQYLKSQFIIRDVMARKARKVMKCFLVDYNIEFRCSYMMSNCALKYLPELYNLPVEKMQGDLDYTLIRTPETELTEKEMGYCNNDCLVVYYYILEELKTYENVDKIPVTSTGHVRRELKERVSNDWSYKGKVKKAVNTDPHVYNLLLDAFMGGYTHSNWIYTDEVLKDVDSWDFTSSYPYVMVTHRYPSCEFKKCMIKDAARLSKRFAYLLVVRFTNIKCKYYNNFISQSKCREIRGGRYDNGRIIQADSLEITLTDIDFRFILDTHTCNYEILECYYATYNYLPKQFIDFILEKYVLKTKYKNVPGKEIEYAKEKGKFNSLYGMAVTNTIRDDVIYDNNTGWSETKLTNDEIVKALEKDKKLPFLSFAYGVWVTAYARNNLLRNVIKLDKYVVYCDTDSLKVLPGYDKSVIDNYNKFVENNIKYVSNLLEIDLNKFAPVDSKGIARMLGLFDFDGHYDEFITQGAKKYAVKVKDKIKITVAGVPKSGAAAIKDLNEFRDDLVFHFKDTNKNLLVYVDNEDPIELIDYKGNKYKVTDKSGCCLLPTTYVLGKSLEYANLISDDSSNRSRFIE